MTPLHYIGEFVRQGLAAVPLPMVRILFVSTLVLVLIWVLRLPDSATKPVAGTRRWDENLKIYACLALVIQILIYTFL